MSYRVSAALFAACTIACAAPALAQSAPSPAPSPSPISEIGRVQTADRRDEPLRDVVKTTFVVTKDEMIRRGDQTVADALAHIPGLNVQRNGPAGTLSDLTLDGYRTNQILLLIDGRPAGGEQVEFPILDTMPTAGVERIEIVEGGGATLYGTGALGGVINVITTGGARHARPFASLDADSLGGRGFAFDNGTFAFSRHVDSNRFSYPAIGPVAPGTAVNADAANTTARISSAGRLGALRIDGSAGLRQDHLGAPGDAEFPPLSTTARENTTTGDARVRLALDRARSSATLELSGTTLTSVYTFDPNDPAYAAGNLFGGTTQLTREGRAQLSLRDVVQSEASTLVAGIDLAHGAARVDDGIAPATLPIAETAAYAQESFLLHGGARVDAGLRGERDGAYGGVVAPSLGTRIPLGGGYQLRANYATGFRAPDVVELAYPTFSNPNLRPERSHGGDLSLDAPVLGGASLRWFVENGNDLISPNPAYDFTAPTSPANPYLINVSRFSIAGFVGTIRTRPFHDVRSSIAITDTYRALDLTGIATRLPRRPVIAGDVTLEYVASHPGALAAAGLLAHVVGPHDTPDTEYTRVDAYARLRAAPGALLSLRVYNLGDARYADVSGFPMPGRTFALELSTR
ncbi:MAG TPA: TonB-dependent receptor [Candidatus Elarobacter sp.]|nr:TonB-dependent receptor [Candidatus Elarobacter sp.]